MIINLVYVKVRPESVAGFIHACRENAHESRQEPGVVSFDVIQETADPASFVLIEAFRDAQGPAAHKETAHYKKWAETVAGMMQEDRRRVPCSDIDFCR
jgi:autoinducer 2-degrading protein